MTNIGQYWCQHIMHPNWQQYISFPLHCYVLRCDGRATSKPSTHLAVSGCKLITCGTVRDVWILFFLFFSFSIIFSYLSHHLLCLCSFKNHRSIILLFASGQFQMGAQRGTFAATIPICTHTWWNITRRGWKKLWRASKLGKDLFAL